MTIRLSEQIVEVEKEIRDRARRYPVMIEKGRLLPETADAKLAALRAVQSTLVWLETNMDWIRAEAQRRAAEARMRAEADELMRHPDVAVVAAAFPGGTITHIEDIEKADS